MRTSFALCGAMTITCCCATRVAFTGRIRLITVQQYPRPQRNAGLIRSRTMTAMTSAKATPALERAGRHHWSVNHDHVNMRRRSRPSTTRHPNRSRRWRLFSTLFSTRTDHQGDKTEEATHVDDVHDSSTKERSRTRGGVLRRATERPLSPVVVVVPPASAGGGDDGGEHLARHRQLADALGVALIVDGKEIVEEDGIVFTMNYDGEGRLALGQPRSGFTPLVVDFCAGKTGYRTKQQQGMEQVVKAASLPKRKQRSPAPEAGADDGGMADGDVDVDDETPLLWDLTAGLGTDAFILAVAGWKVQMFERSRTIAVLVQDALDRARNSSNDTARAAAWRMNLHVADSTTARAGTPVTDTESSGQNSNGVNQPTQQDVSPPSNQRPAVVYLDPMFPHRKKSALVKKGMQMLQALLETEQDEESGAGGDGRSTEDADSRGSGAIGTEKRRREEEWQLFETAMRLATCKVVVKRPVNGARIVDDINPSHSVVSKNGRFDVYTAP